MRRTAWRARFTSVAVACCLPVAAMAQTEGDIRWNGFLNVVAGALRDAPYSATDEDATAPGYRGYTAQWTFDRQTSAGLQAVKPLADTLSVTTQVYAEGRTDNYAASMRWLYVTWDQSDSSRLRVGRIGEPVYYFSDFLNVGYAYSWVAPPYDVYVYDPTITGFAWQYRGLAGPVDWSAEIFAGNSEEFQASINAQTTTRNARGLVLNGVYDGWLTLRALLLRQENDFAIEALDPEVLIDGAFATVVEQGILTQPVADIVKPLATRTMTDYFVQTTRLEQLDSRYSEVAAKAELGPWWLMAEWTRLYTGDYIQNKSSSWFAGVGYRINTVTLHGTYSEFHQPVSHAVEEDAASLPASGSIEDQSLWLARQTASAVAASFAGHWYTQIAGVSWNATPSAVWKAEVTHFNKVAAQPGDATVTGTNMLYTLGVSATF